MEIIKMARFILDIASKDSFLTENERLNIIDTFNKSFSSSIASLSLIDTSNRNQFHEEDKSLNDLNEEQIKSFKENNLKEEA
tara:strand:+ start:222 stop:467 length:246 start_codon:yes stop_codon:yes gene_type:complete